MTSITFFISIIKCVGIWNSSENLSLIIYIAILIYFHIPMFTIQKPPQKYLESKTQLQYENKVWI